MIQKDRIKEYIKWAKNPDKEELWDLIERVRPKNKKSKSAQFMVFGQDMLDELYAVIENRSLKKSQKIEFLRRVYLFLSKENPDHQMEILPDICLRDLDEAVIMKHCDKGRYWQVPEVHLEILHVLIMKLYKDKQLDETLTWIEEALRINPFYSVGMVIKCEILQNRLSISEYQNMVSQLFNNIISIPEGADFLFNYGLYLFERNDREKASAILSFREVLMDYKYSLLQSLGLKKLEGDELLDGLFDLGIKFEHFEELAQIFLDETHENFELDEEYSKLCIEAGMER